MHFEAADSAFAVIAVQGPAAGDLLSRLAGQTLDLATYEHVEVLIAGEPVRVIHRREGGVAGFHCWTAAAHGAALWAAIADVAVPVGMQALDTLRVEAGIPWYGRDVDETLIFPETRLEQLVSFTKGCYIGQEVVARVKYRGHINRGLSGFVLEGDRVPGAGARVVAAGKEIGRVTSAVWSFALDRPIALGYVRREHFEPGSPVDVDDGGGILQAKVAALPFIEPAA